MDRLTELARFLAEHATLSLTAIAATATLAWGATAYLRFWRAIAKGSRFPVPAPPSFPLGNVLLIRNFYDMLDKVHAARDPVTGLAQIWIASRPVVVVLKADHVNKVFNASSYRRPITMLSNHNEKMLGKHNITAMMNDEWRAERSLMGKPFQYAPLREMAPIMAAAAVSFCDFLSTLPAEEAFDIHPMLRCVTMDVIGLTAFHYNFSCIENLSHGPPKELEAFEFLLDEYTRRAFTFSGTFFSNYWMPTSANRKHRRARQIVRDRIAEIIAHRRRLVEAGQAPQDILGAMLEAHSGDNTEATIDQLVLLMFAGFDTTSLTLSYATFILGSQPAIQAALHAEVDRVLGGRTATFEDINELKYTLQVVKETMRLYPAAPLTSRTLTSDVELEDGIVLPADTDVWIPLRTIQRSPLNWERPDEIDPHRFDAGNVIHPGAWVPFSGGPRNCLGMKFALQEATLVLATLAQRFTIESMCKTHELPTHRSGVVSKPTNGVFVKITPRAH
eukprot:m.128916 g.128916  ORF g.128916 m.128916 type:complete len:504 (+) comp9422_c0_seq4:43-1554(+)